MKKRKPTPEEKLMENLKQYFTQETEIRKEMLSCLQILNKKYDAKSN